MRSICSNIVFLSHILQVQTYNLFYLDLLYLDNVQFLAIWLIYFFVQYFFLVLILFDCFVYFSIFSNIFLNKYGFSSSFLLIFEVKFSFLKSIESIYVLKKCPASAGILFFSLIFSRYKLIIYFILIFCI